jgi:hypothetical protein
LWHPNGSGLERKKEKEYEKGDAMNANFKRSIGSTLLLVLLGLLAFLAGAKWLVVLVPAAVLVWFGASPALRSGRN